MASDAPPVDGRRARRERSRIAVIDAVFALIGDGKVPPSVEQIADRSGVSVSSIFRMFDGLDDMRSQAFRQFEIRYAHLLATDVDDTMDTALRIERFVRSRVELYSTAGPLMAMARHRALDHEPLAARISAQRVRLAGQTRRCFGPEARRLTPADGAHLIALIDATTSPEAFEVLGASHGRTRRQIDTTWRRALAALIAGWDATPTGSTDPNREH